MLVEVLSLAELGGMRRYVLDAHPLMTDAVAGVSPDAQAVAIRDPGARTAPRSDRVEAMPVGGLLTPKEARILGLLATGQTN